MDYKEALRFYFNNVGVKDPDSNAIGILKQDFANTLSEMFSMSRAPKKDISYNIRETEDVVESFSDTTLEENFAISSGFTISGGKAVTTSSGILTISNLSEVGKITLLVGASPVSSPIVVFPQVNVSIKNDLNESLYDDTFDFTDDTGVEETLEIALAIKGVNLTLQITLIKNEDTTNAYISNFALTKEVSSILMPDDFFVPLEVVFRQSNGSQIATNELFYERWKKWIPNQTFSTESEVISETSLVSSKVTEENIDFDGSIGYCFNVTINGTYLLFKHTFNGTLTVVYSHLPITSQLKDGYNIQLNKAFFETFLNGAVYRAFVRKLKETQTEVQLNAFVISMREYKSAYQKGLQFFSAATSTTAEPAMVKPFTMDDPNMIAR